MNTPPLSIFDMLKIGVGPSSSHTMGPWRAARRVLDELPAPGIEQVSRITVELYGSLAKTGKGHGTVLALLMGLAGEDPETVETTNIEQRIKRLRDTKRLSLLGRHEIALDPAVDIVFVPQALPFHPNGMRFLVELQDATRVERVLYSIGGGFIVAEDEADAATQHPLPCPIETAGNLLAHCASTAGRIADVVMQNELTWRDEEAIAERLDQLRDVMFDSVYRGCHAEGVLPGGLGVKRRAGRTARELIGGSTGLASDAWLDAIRGRAPDFQEVLDWVSCFALAVNEENAAFGRIVTAPTNGAAGVIPAVLLYAQLFCNTPAEFHRPFLLTAGQVGCLFKHNATISAAAGGCQAEIGVSSAMAAAALTECLGGSPKQAAVAAEIAMEHHLGLTCDPIGGLVQVPCIERNAFGAVKAITAAHLALRRDPDAARVSLQDVIETMWQTAQDMSEKYKETSEGGLAVKIPVNVIEC